MDRSEAVRRVRLLAEVRVDRGATANEAAVARRKAQQLIERYGLSDPEVRVRAQPPPRARPYQPPPRPHQPPKTTARPFWREPEFAAWMFDVSTGAHSDNVTVHHYRDRSNWRIEIDV
jgi:hypothetical protein